MWQDDLSKLSGMVYKQAQWTPNQWLAKTGTDPLVFPGYVIINRSGRCIWTPKAERLYQKHKRHEAWVALGVIV